MDENVPLASAYRLNGVNFRMSAQALARQLQLDGAGRPTSLTAIPMYFLASQSAELFLKAALLKRGVAEPELRTHHLRHDLGGLLQALHEKQVVVTPDTEAVVLGLSERHRNHQLRYTVLIDDGAKTYWPPPSLIFAALEELLMLTRTSDA
jgi:hypothetical protein